MGCGLSSGGGKRSLDYLFGSGEAPKAATSKPTTNNAPVTAVRDVPSVSTEKTANQLVEARQTSAIPVGVNRPLNNYNRADGQKTGNFITIMAGLLGQYNRAGSAEPLKTVTLMADYFYKRVQNVVMTYEEIGTFFLDAVNSTHSIGTGGSSVSEFWADPKRLGDRLHTENEEIDWWLWHLRGAQKSTLDWITSTPAVYNVSLRGRSLSKCSVWCHP